MAKLVQRDEVKERLQVQAAGTVRVGRQQSRIPARRRVANVLAHSDPEISAPGRHHHDARADLTFVIVKNGSPYGCLLCQSS
jgi:hypothetical protein